MIYLHRSCYVIVNLLATSADSFRVCTELLYMREKGRFYYSYIRTWNIKSVYLLRSRRFSRQN